MGATGQQSKPISLWQVVRHVSLVPLPRDTRDSKATRRGSESSRLLPPPTLLVSSSSDSEPPCPRQGPTVALSRLILSSGRSKRTSSSWPLQRLWRGAEIYLEPGVGLAPRRRGLRRRCSRGTTSLFEAKGVVRVVSTTLRSASHHAKKPLRQEAQAVWQCRPSVSLGRAPRAQGCLPARR